MAGRPLGAQNRFNPVDAIEPVAIIYVNSGQIKFNKAAQIALGRPEAVNVILYPEENIATISSAHPMMSRGGDFPLKYYKAFGAEGWRGFHSRELASFMLAEHSQENFAVPLRWSQYYSKWVMEPNKAIPLETFKASLKNRR